MGNLWYTTLKTTGAKREIYVFSSRLAFLTAGIACTNKRLQYSPLLQ